MGYMAVAQSTEPQSTFLLLAEYNTTSEENFPSEKQKKKKKKRVPWNPETSRVHLNSFMNERVVLSVLLSLRGSQEKQDSYFPQRVYNPRWG